MVVKVLAVVVVLVAGVVLLFTLEPWRTLEEKLCRAALFDDVAAVRGLLDRGAEPSAGSTARTTPLYWAAHHGNVELARLLLDRGADVDRGEHEDATPLFIAVHQGRQEVVKLLLDRGADPGRVYGYLGWTPLHAAAETVGRIPPELLERLARACPAAMAHRDKRGLTPLALAMANAWDVRFDPVIRALLRAGAAPNDWDALVKAPARHLVALLDAGASPRSTSPDGAETLLHAVARSGTTSSAELLLARGAPVDAPSRAGNRPLALALRERRGEMAVALLAGGASPDEPDARGCRPLQGAVASGLPDVVEALFRRGVKAELCPDLLERVASVFAAEATSGVPDPASMERSSPTTLPPGLCDKLVALAGGTMDRIRTDARAAMAAARRREQAERERTQRELESRKRYEKSLERIRRGTR